MADAINPAHYKGLFETKEHETIMVTRHLDFCLGNYYKYIERLYKKDNPVQDFEKACWYVSDWIAHHQWEPDNENIFNPCAEKAAIAFAFIKEPEHGTELWWRWMLLRVVTEKYINRETWFTLLHEYREAYIDKEKSHD